MNASLPLSPLHSPLPEEKDLSNRQEGMIFPDANGTAVSISNRDFFSPTCFFFDLKPSEYHHR